MRDDVGAFLREVLSHRRRWTKLAGVSARDAEDLLQNALVRFLEHHRDVEPWARESYLRTALRHEKLHFWGEEAIRRKYAPLIEAHLGELRSPFPPSDTEIARRELLEAVSCLLEGRSAPPGPGDRGAVDPRRARHAAASLAAALSRPPNVPDSPRGAGAPNASAAADRHGKGPPSWSDHAAAGALLACALLPIALSAHAGVEHASAADTPPNEDAAIAAAARRRERPRARMPRSPRSRAWRTLTTGVRAIDRNNAPVGNRDDMQSPSDELPLCSLCGKKTATEKYALSGRPEMVCAACLERRQVRDALEDELIHIMALEHRKQYEDALVCLDTILAANRDRDHDGWLARSVAHDRAVLLFKTGRHAEALKAYDAWAELGFEDVSQRWMHADGTARTLEALGRDREAVAVLKEALSHQDPKYLPSALWVLTALARLSGKAGQPFDSKWLTIAEAVAERYGIDVPIADSPGEAILALEEAARGRQPKRSGE